jgi:hypothetical protein
MRVRMSSFQCECGQYITLLPPSAADMAAMIMGKLQGAPEFDIFVLGPDTANCSRCGREIALPAVETLDLDRDLMGAMTQSVIHEIEVKSVLPPSVRDN